MEGKSPLSAQMLEKATKDAVGAVHRRLKIRLVADRRRKNKGADDGLAKTRRNPFDLISLAKSVLLADSYSVVVAQGRQLPDNGGDINLLPCGKA